jgi:hypothetical protein
VYKQPDNKLIKHKCNNKSFFIVLFVYFDKDNNYLRQ